MQISPLNMDEIQAKFPDRWVILDQVLMGPGPVVRGGRVIFDCSDETVLYSHLNLLPKGGHYAIRFTGKPPEDISFAL